MKHVNQYLLVASLIAAPVLGGSKSSKPKSTEPKSSKSVAAMYPLRENELMSIPLQEDGSKSGKSSNNLVHSITALSGKSSKGGRSKSGKREMSMVDTTLSIPPTAGKSGKISKQFNGKTSKNEYRSKAFKSSKKVESKTLKSSKSSKHGPSHDELSLSVYYSESMPSIAPSAAPSMVPSVDVIIPTTARPTDGDSFLFGAKTAKLMKNDDEEDDENDSEVMRGNLFDTIFDTQQQDKDDQDAVTEVALTRGMSNGAYGNASISAVMWIGLVTHIVFWF